MQMLIKRLADIIFSAFGLLVIAPVLLVLAVLVHRNLGSPVLFCQQRIGKHERPFTLVKFRSMRDGEDEDAARLNNFGVWLRSNSFDELPELWNVLKGDMSLVGPRPLLPEYLPFYTEHEKIRHHVRPGLTGLAQVSGRNALSWDQRLALDVQYVQNFSLKLDLQIIWRTVLAVLQRRGISAEGHATMQRLDEVRKGKT